jgi:hypothetical protein
MIINFAVFFYIFFFKSFIKKYLINNEIFFYVEKNFIFL